MRLRQWGFNAVASHGESAGRDDGLAFLASAEFCAAGPVIQAPGVRLPRHGHQCAYFSLVVAGGYRERLPRASRERPALSVAFHPAGEEHSEDFLATRGATFSIEFSESWRERMESESPGWRQPRHWVGGPVRAPVGPVPLPLKTPST